MIGRLWHGAKKRAFVSGPVTTGRRFHLGLLSYVSSVGGLNIGDDVYIGKFCSIQVNGRIGNGVLIANNVGVVGRRDHDMRALGVPIRGAPWIGDTPALANHPANAIDIGDDVWIGFGAVILSGITIHRGVIIAAGSVVSDNIAPYDIVAGNPARVVGRRFTDAQIIEHEAGIKLRKATL